MSKPFVFIVFCVLAGSAPSTRVNADLVFSFGRADGSGVADFVVEPGSKVMIDLFISETGGSVLNDIGIGTVRFRLEVAGDGVTHGALDEFQIGAGFRAVGSNTRADSIRMVDISGAFAGIDVIPVQAASGSNTVFLGTATLQVDPSFDGTVFLTASQLSPIDVTLGTSIFNSGSVSSGTATITAVPEPGSLLALSMLGLGGIVWHRRRSAVRRTAATG